MEGRIQTIRRTRRFSRKATRLRLSSISRKGGSSSRWFPQQGKEAVIAILGSGEFFGEGCLTGQPQRMSTVTTLSECSIVRIDKADTVRVLHDEPAFSEMFLHYLLSRNIRIEEDLVEHLFNSSEKRLARALLLLANFGKSPRR